VWLVGTLIVGAAQCFFAAEVASVKMVASTAICLPPSARVETGHAPLLIKFFASGRARYESQGIRLDFGSRGRGAGRHSVRTGKRGASPTRPNEAGVPECAHQ